MIIEYEVWSNYGMRNETLVHNTPSLKEAKEIAQSEQDAGEEGIQVLWFDDDGEMHEVDL